MSIKQRPTTSADVARLAGVSRTTVSYVLNETPNLSIKADTRERVLAAARELNYQLQPAARALRKGCSDDIIFMVDRPLTHFVRDLVRIYDKRAQELGYRLVVCFTDELSPEARHDYLLSLFSTRPAGIIAPSEIITRKDMELAGGNSPMPVVSLGYGGKGAGSGLPVVEAARVISEHLIERGHRKLGLIAPQLNYLTGHIEERLTGMRAVLENEAGSDVAVFPVTASTLVEGRRVAGEIRNHPMHPTAIFGFNDEYSFPLLRAFYEQGIRVPQDIAVVGTDNLAFGEMTTPSLTSLSFDLQALGTRAIDLIDTTLRSDGVELPVQPLQPMPLPTLIVREST